MYRIWKTTHGSFTGCYTQKYVVALVHTTGLLLSYTLETYSLVLNIVYEVPSSFIYNVLLHKLF